MVDFAKAMQDKIAAAAAETNMNEAQTGGGGSYTPPAAGLTRLRFISYIELGVHKDEYKGEVKTKEKVALQFELSGPKHPASDEATGRTSPHIITINESLSLNEKANFYKLFKRMNYEGTATHMAQLLGKDFLATVIQYDVGEGDNKKTKAKLRDDGGYTIRPPFVDDPETGESRRIPVAEPQTPIKCFLWSYADKDMWDSIFIDGKYDDRKDDKGNVTKVGVSKNHWQNLIKSAINFAGSPAAEFVVGGGDALELGEGEKPARTEANTEASKASKVKGKGAAADPLEEMA